MHSTISCRNWRLFHRIFRSHCHVWSHWTYVSNEDHQVLGFHQNIWWNNLWYLCGYDARKPEWFDLCIVSYSVELVQSQWCSQLGRNFRPRGRSPQWHCCHELACIPLRLWTTQSAEGTSYQTSQTSSPALGHSETFSRTLGSRPCHTYVSQSA